VDTVSSSRYRRTHLSISVAEGSDEKLRKLAENLGYVCQRGPGSASSSGSISSLVEALASGELEVMRMEQPPRENAKTSAA
jgi:hypothetical protein